MTYKICSKCSQIKSNNEFVKDKRCEDNTRSYCKECNNLMRRKTPIQPITKQGYKICSKCNFELQLNKFNVRTSNGVKKPFSYCKECERTYNNARYNHKCSNCGKEYKSGKKTSDKCKTCFSKDFSKIGKSILVKLNANQSGENNHMYGIQRFGANNPNYNPLKTDREREEGRLIEGYGVWRRKVYERDDYTCVCCGDKQGGNLSAHHLNSWDWCKVERLDLKNGVTLCNECHKAFHLKYGFGKNTKEQFDEFKDNFKTIR